MADTNFSDMRGAWDITQMSPEEKAELLALLTSSDFVLPPGATVAMKEQGVSLTSIIAALQKALN